MADSSPKHMYLHLGLVSGITISCTWLLLFVTLLVPKIFGFQYSGIALLGLVVGAKFFGEWLFCAQCIDIFDSAFGDWRAVLKRSLDKPIALFYFHMMIFDLAAESFLVWYACTHAIALISCLLLLLGSQMIGAVFQGNISDFQRSSMVVFTLIAYVVLIVLLSMNDLFFVNQLMVCGLLVGKGLLINLATVSKAALGEIVVLEALKAGHVSD